MAFGITIYLNDGTNFSHGYIPRNVIRQQTVNTSTRSGLGRHETGTIYRGVTPNVDYKGNFEWIVVPSGTPAYWGGIFIWHRGDNIYYEKWHWNNQGGNRPSGYDQVFYAHSITAIGIVTR
ncbi:hypothetical protein AB733_11660 [Photobacterium swingsii]|uniref:Uncharacterized protein n=1 Tax=Photobacterium swingsii TaxID=680026 RepID=A0A0J8VCS2_9GAMM|nr:hypothetical protein AB733_11660 [Photobacterium swingsii]PSW24502.1 hypothetical protein C9I94_10725 [Photobacterium swingsii]